MSNYGVCKFAPSIFGIEYGGAGGCFFIASHLILHFIQSTPLANKRIADEYRNSILSSFTDRARGLSIRSDDWGAST